MIRTAFLTDNTIDDFYSTFFDCCKDGTFHWKARDLIPYFQICVYVAYDPISLTRAYGSNVVRVRHVLVLYCTTTHHSQVQGDGMEESLEETQNTILYFFPFHK
mmetsp:Transcript_3201/g.3406  ORF Transcript_3201/g.3406 Transcript_3201/m.3406 type:complete len:104 (+) Transcript_3201:203-514(+)